MTEGDPDRRDGDDPEHREGSDPTGASAGGDAQDRDDEAGRATTDESPAAEGGESDETDRTGSEDATEGKPESREDADAVDGEETDQGDAGEETTEGDAGEEADGTTGTDGSEGGSEVTISADPPELGPYDREDYATEFVGDEEGARHAPGRERGRTPIEEEPMKAPDDQEMPLADHIEEMVRRLAVVIVVMAAISAVVFPLGDRLINFLWYSFLPGPISECVQAAGGPVPDPETTTAACPRLYHPLSLVLARLKVASLTGFIVALPVFVYETYLFMRPGLYPNERRYYLASVPTSLILAGVGVAFAYFLVLPVIFTYFLGYSQPVAEIAFGLSETFGLILLMLGMFAVIFQIPLFVMLAIMMGVTSRRWLEDRRLYFWFGFAGLAFLFSPDPTGMAPFIVGLTMVVLFEGTLLALRWTGR